METPRKGLTLHKVATPQKVVQREVQDPCDLRFTASTADPASLAEKHSSTTEDGVSLNEGNSSQPDVPHVEPTLQPSDKRGGRGSHGGGRGRRGQGGRGRGHQEEPTAEHITRSVDATSTPLGRAFQAAEAARLREPEEPPAVQVTSDGDSSQSSDSSSSSSSSSRRGQGTGAAAAAVASSDAEDVAPLVALVPVPTTSRAVTSPIVEAASKPCKTAAEILGKDPDQVEAVAPGHGSKVIAALPEGADKEAEPWRCHLLRALTSNPNVGKGSAQNFQQSVLEASWVAPKEICFEIVAILQVFRPNTCGPAKAKIFSVLYPDKPVPQMFLRSKAVPRGSQTHQKKKGTGTQEDKVDVQEPGLAEPSPAATLGRWFRPVEVGD